MKRVITHKRRQYHFEYEDRDLYMDGEYLSPEDARDLAVAGTERAAVLLKFLRAIGANEDEIFGIG